MTIQSTNTNYSNIPTIMVIPPESEGTNTLQLPPPRGASLNYVHNRNTASARRQFERSVSRSGEEDGTVETVRATTAVRRQAHLTDKNGVASDIDVLTSNINAWTSQLERIKANINGSDIDARQLDVMEDSIIAIRASMKEQSVNISTALTGIHRHLNECVKTKTQLENQIDILESQMEEGIASATQLSALPKCVTELFNVDTEIARAKFDMKLAEFRSQCLSGMYAKFESHDGNPNHLIRGKRLELMEHHINALSNAKLNAAQDLVRELKFCASVLKRFSASDALRQVTIELSHDALNNAELLKNKVRELEFYTSILKKLDAGDEHVDSALRQLHHHIEVLHTASTIF